MLSSNDIRERFLAFFANRGHARVASSPLVPGDDPTLLFTNAGMVQFKDVFLGFDKRSYKMATTSQRCLRAGGKHNDLENVGYTARHHTFFEMLGNFSFGNYFKEQAIPLAWELLTAPQDQGGYGLGHEHIWVTVFGGGKLFGLDSPAVPADDEARDIWIKTLKQAGFSAQEAALRVTAIPTTDNFWMMGDIGPCGPCSEIFYNRDKQATRFEGEDEDKADSCVEVWNLVFMQFNRDAQGVLYDLPTPCVDTGMGLERLSAVLQGKDSNYETDLFVALVTAARQAIKDAGGTVSEDSASLRVIADHIRAAAYLVADKVLPANEGRGYVLRRIIRRALRHGYQLSAKRPFFASLVAPLAELMGEAHPELPNQIERVTKVLSKEEERFTRTLHEGMRILTKEVKDTDGVIDGPTVFKLYDTYGFPADLTASYARENAMTVDMAGFERELSIQRTRSRAASSFAINAQAIEYSGVATDFERDPNQQVVGEVLSLYNADGKQVEVLEEGEEGLVILSATAFYGEAGGQLGDRGELSGEDGQTADVRHTIKVRADVHGHQVQVSAGELRCGLPLRSMVDCERRVQLCRAHSATHLLHEALRRFLGEHVEQRGSLVDEDRLRFDFSHDGQIGLRTLKRIEREVNEKVMANSPVVIQELTYDDAIKRGARALFGEKYGATVRMVTIDPDYSIELCGGTHVGCAAEISYVYLMSEEAVAAGIRRIEARVGLKAHGLIRRYAYTVDTLERMVKHRSDAPAKEEFEDVLNGVPGKSLVQGMQGVLATLRDAETDLKQIRQRDSDDENQSLLVDKKYHDTVAGRILVAVTRDKDMAALTTQAKDVLELLGLSMVMVLAKNDGKAGMVAIVRPIMHEKITARDWLTKCMFTLDAKGGGKAEVAQAGGGDPAKLNETREFAEKFVLDLVG